MKNQFLRKLNHELGILTREERRRYISEYEETILDQMENGMTEEEAVSNLGEVKQIANDILRSYVEQDGGKTSNCKHYFNRMYVVYDAIVLVISYISAYCFLNSLREEHLLIFSFASYMAALLYILPGYLILYYFFNLYTLNGTRKKGREDSNIILANIIGFFVFAFILYLFKQANFSRILIFTFACINIMLEMIGRSFIYRKLLILV